MPTQVFTPPKGADVLEVVTREMWGGKPPLPDGPQLQHPVDTVRFSHTYTFECFNLDECGRWLRKMQRMHMEQRKVDIQYNFFIASDRRIYEGAGWFADCWKPPELRHLHKKCLDIAYLGNYTSQRLLRLHSCGFPRVADCEWDMIERVEQYKHLEVITDISYPDKDLQALAKKIINYGVFHKYITNRVKLLLLTDPECTIGV